MAIVIDTSAKKIDTAGSPITFAYTCGAGATLLVVTAQLWQDTPGTGSITGITYNSVAMSYAGGFTGASISMRTEIWYLMSPTTGSSKNIVVTETGTIDQSDFMVSSWTGTLTSGVLGVVSTGSTGSASPITNTITSGTANSVLIDSASRYGILAVTKGANQTLIQSDISANITGASSYQITTTTGNYTLTWTTTGSNDWSDIIAEFKPATGGAATPVASDTSAITDSVAMFKSAQSPAPISDTSAVTDTNVIAFGYLRPTTVTSTTTVTDSNSIAFGYLRPTAISDTTTITDTVTIGTIYQGILPSDTTTITDSVKIVQVYDLNPSDTATITDTNTIEIFLQGIKPSDTTTVTDSVVMFLPYYTPSASDSTAVTDSTTIFLPYYTPSVSNTTTVTDTVSLYETVYFLSVSNTTTVTDTVSLYETTYFLAVSDTIAVTDSVVFGENLFDAIASDTTVVTDNVSISEISFTDLVNVSDTTTVTDSVNMVISGGVVYHGVLERWDGANFVKAKLETILAGVWQVKPLYRFDGVNWLLVNDTGV